MRKYIRYICCFLDLLYTYMGGYFEREPTWYEYLWGWRIGPCHAHQIAKGIWLSKMQ